ncbi:hypothetical protein [Nocardiopsis sp. JB363]|uniref:hypothetical protein n=1 Tax=Nocardiopsis sp. JB363 TaxID=1434837 RepID=UPI001F21E6E0|nr:hypothetical protein [Nocardiopsis sp. JB363]
MKAEGGRSGASGVGRGLAVGTAMFGAMALLGAAIAPLWWWLAPRPEVTALGGGDVFAGATQEVFAGEGYFVLITGLAGVVTGYACYMIQFTLSDRREQDLRLPLLLVSFLGAVAGSALVWRIGVALDGPAREVVLAAEPGDTVTGALQLQALAFLIVWPFVHVLQYGLLDGISLLRSDQPGVPEPVPEPVRAPESEPAPEEGAKPDHGPLAPAPPTAVTDSGRNPRTSRRAVRRTSPPRPDGASSDSG